MNVTALIDELGGAQRCLRELGARAGPEHFRRQFHADLSPAGWHLGHCAWTEDYWIGQRLLGDDSGTRALADLYIPARAPKATRGDRLPDWEALMRWVAGRQDHNRERLLALMHEPDPQPLLRRAYLPRFLLQHTAQHCETLCLLLRQLQARLAERTPPASPLPMPAPAPAPSARDGRVLPAGRYRIGAPADSGAYDNELPAHEIDLDTVALARAPVSNAEYLGFMRAGAYADGDLWDTAGEAWLRRHRCEAPEHWRRDPRGNWYEIGLDGPAPLPAQAPVEGLSLHEARAFARWAGARLPHEYEWEVACRLGLLQTWGRVWEWCDNPLHPYPGFRAFPYAGYSSTWFDGAHLVLRGGGRHTLAAVRRPSFRNFYQADKRHIGAGLRLAWD